MRVFVDGKLISTIKPRLMSEIAAISIFKDESTVIVPIYPRLADRADFPQPKPFDDINNDGLPDFVCVERQTSLSNHGPYPAAIRVFSLSGDKLVELEPVLLRIGEAIHFDDFNKDGVLELVNTDDERDFTYRSDGLPNSNLVWRWSEASKRYVKLANVSTQRHLSSE